MTAHILLFALLGFPVEAQQVRDTTGVVRVSVRSDVGPVRDATVETGIVRSRTSNEGIAALTLVAGSHTLVVRKLGFRPESLTVSVAAGSTVAREIALTGIETDLDAVVITSTRGERRVEAEPTRVEVLAREEIEEKLLMTPGDIAMMLNETSGLRVQTTSPSLGGANVRVQGLRGRYTQILSDGLPLYGGQAGGLGLLQIPPMDLRQVEVIKGAASALYGSSALGGVINLLSRLPGDEHERELLLNQTTRGGTDGIVWLAGPVRDGWGYTLLGGAHRQSQRDIDGDGWTDLAGYERLVVRPRAFWNSEAGHSLFVTAGYTDEAREGGTLPGRVAPDGAAFAEALDTQRSDAGVAGRMLFALSSLSLRASAMEQSHTHRFGLATERDRHRTGFAELAWTRTIGAATVVIGTALQSDEYRADELPAFDYSFRTTSAFVQADGSPAERVSLTASARVDDHSEYGTFVNPRVAALFRLGNDWTLRASGATGAFAPSPFTEESEVVGLTQLQPLVDVRAERAVTWSVDIGGPAGAFEVNATLFGSRVRHPLALVVVDTDPDLRLINAAEPTLTSGGELFARWSAEPFGVTATYAHVLSREFDPGAGQRRAVPLIPRHSAGVVAMWEDEERGRVGFEFYYTGRQPLEENPYRAESRSYVIVGALAEWRVTEWARVFVNAENLGDVRQTRYDPLVRPSPGRGGRWTTDAWTELSGRTVNAGVRIGG